MKARLRSTCFGSSTEIDGIPIDNLSKKELIEIWAKMVNKKATKDVIINQINNIIEVFGEETYFEICDQCGDWNYDMDFDF